MLKGSWRLKGRNLTLSVIVTVSSSSTVVIKGAKRCHASTQRGKANIDPVGSEWVSEVEKLQQKKVDRDKLE